MWGCRHGGDFWGQVAYAAIKLLLFILLTLVLIRCHFGVALMIVVRRERRWGCRHGRDP